MVGRRLALAGLALLALSGCQAHLKVEVRARTDGSGQVRAAVILDKEAAAQVPDLARQVRVDDLEEAGWRVEGASSRNDGGSQMQAVKSFRSPAGAARALEELSGPKGPFRDFSLTVDRSYLETRTALRGTVDLSQGLEGFSDDVLAQRLSSSGLGKPLGVDLATVERQLGVPLREAFRFEVVSRLPGEEPTVWRPELGRRMQLEATTRRWNGERIAAGAVAVLAGLSLMVVLVRRLLT